MASRIHAYEVSSIPTQISHQKISLYYKSQNICKPHTPRAVGDSLILRLHSPASITPCKKVGGREGAWSKVQRYVNIFLLFLQSLSMDKNHVHKLIGSLKELHKTGEGACSVVMVTNSLTREAT